MVIYKLTVELALENYMIKTGISALESARDLSLSGESDFFSTMASGWALRKSLL